MIYRGRVACMAPMPPPARILAPSHPSLVVARDSINTDYMSTRLKVSSTHTCQKDPSTPQSNASTKPIGNEYHGNLSQALSGTRDSSPDRDPFGVKREHGRARGWRTELIDEATIGNDRTIKMTCSQLRSLQIDEPWYPSREAENAARKQNMPILRYNHAAFHTDNLSNLLT